MMLGCVIRTPTPAMPRPESLGLCVDGPLGIEFCPQLDLQWKTKEQREQEKLEKQLQEERERYWREEWERRLKERKPYPARVIV